MTDCKHLHGASIAEVGGWVCGQCYRNIGYRPTRYARLTPPLVPGSYQIEWQAEIRVAESGMTLSDFISVIAQWLHGQDRSLSLFEAGDAALEILLCTELEFGHPDMDWTKDAAVDLAREYVSDFWEPDAGEDNE